MNILQLSLVFLQYTFHFLIDSEIVVVSRLKS